MADDRIWACIFRMGASPGVPEPAARAQTFSRKRSTAYARAQPQPRSRTRSQRPQQGKHCTMGAVCSFCFRAVRGLDSNTDVSCRHGRLDRRYSSYKRVRYGDNCNHGRSGPSRPRRCEFRPAQHNGAVRPRHSRRDNMPVRPGNTIRTLSDTHYIIITIR